MGAAAICEQMIPLGPGLRGLARTIDDDEAIAELGCRRGGLLVEGTPESGEIGRKRGRQFQLAAIGYEDSVRRLREDAAGRSPDITRLGKHERLRPPLCDIVGPGAIVTPFFLERCRRR